MSLEILVLLALFTLLPIIEQAWRKHREARERARRRALGLPPIPPPVPVPHPLPPPIPRVPPGHAPLPANRGAFDDDEEDAPVIVRPAPRSRPKPIRPAVTRSPVVPRVAAHVRTVDPRTRRQRAHLRGVARDRGAVRRGVVLMTVLGPCRANAPYDTPAVGGNARDQ